MDHDPFFAIGGDSTWNACIGKQGNEQNYLFGYIEAAVELVNSLFEKEQFSKRDTLVLPILYNARHAIELALKMANSELCDMGVIAQTMRKNHNILSHWNYLVEARPGDELLRQLFNNLQPFVVSLSQIDKDGQEFRYHETREGTQSLQGHAVTSLILIRESLRSLHEILNQLTGRIYELRHERSGGFYTQDLSRRDLIEIAKLLPARSEWGTEAFDIAKNKVKERYAIGSNKFSHALKLIQANREARVLIDQESDLEYISDEKAQLLMERHTAIYQKRNQAPERSGFISFADLDFWGDFQRLRKQREVCKDLIDSLSAAEIADARVIFYLGRDGTLPETYERRVQDDIRQCTNAGDLYELFSHVFLKVNFRQHFIIGVRALGKMKLSIKLDEYGSTN